jgi:transcriptional regulator with XRE-family HTH domain
MEIEKDFLDELIEEGTTEDPEFAQLVEAGRRARALVRMLARARDQAGITQAELARRIGTTQSAVARLEGAERDPRLSTVVRYAQIVGRELIAADAEAVGTAAPGPIGSPPGRSRPSSSARRGRTRKRITT